MVLALQFQSLQLFQQEEIHFCSNFKVSKMLPNKIIIIVKVKRKKKIGHADFYFGLNDNSNWNYEEIYFWFFFFFIEKVEN